MLWAATENLNSPIDNATYVTLFVTDKTLKDTYEPQSDASAANG
jgi:hypothetical protein